RILTVYCDQESRVRFASWGYTLLEEHAPGAIGNPAAIITGVDRDMVAQAQRLCTELGWTGYANFDLKHDRRDGRTKFFELNPPLGRSYECVAAGGHNAVTGYVDEHLGGALPEEGPGSGIGEDGILQEQPEVLYAGVPIALIRRYTTLREARARLRRVLKARRIGNPLHYPGVDDSLSRRRYVLAAGLNSVLKFQRYYRPEGGDRISRLLRRRSGTRARTARERGGARRGGGGPRRPARCRRLVPSRGRGARRPRTGGDLRLPGRADPRHRGRPRSGASGPAGLPALPDPGPDGGDPRPPRPRPRPGDRPGRGDAPARRDRRARAAVQHGPPLRAPGRGGRRRPAAEHRRDHRAHRRGERGR